MNHAGGLLLQLAVGVVTFACGGTTLRNHDDDSGSGGSNPNGGSNPSGGTSGVGGGPGKMLPPTGGTGPGPSRCTSPKTDPRSGLVTCTEQYTHRPTAVSCDIVGGAPAEAAGGGGSDVSQPVDLPRADPGRATTVYCKDSSDCRGFQYGYCDLGPGMLGASKVCLSGCLDDADCSGGICLCTGFTDHGGECVPSRCSTDTDCGAGLLCASYDDACGGTFFACQSPNDECGETADCPAHQICTFNGVARVCIAEICGE